MLEKLKNLNLSLVDLKRYPKINIPTIIQTMIVNRILKINISLLNQAIEQIQIIKLLISKAFRHQNYRKQLFLRFVKINAVIILTVVTFISNAILVVV